MAQPVAFERLDRALDGHLEVVSDVPTRYVELFEKVIDSTSASSIRIATSAGSSGSACMKAVADSTADLSRVELYFADERCVPLDSADLNANSISRALGHRLGELRSYHPMSPSAGASSYDALLRLDGPFDLLQLGMGPDGHTASLFPQSSALSAPRGALVVENVDPLGNNAHPRLTLTFEAIAHSRRIVVTVVGADKASALEQIANGIDLPVTHVHGAEVHWLIDERAVGGMSR